MENSAAAHNLSYLRRDSMPTKEVQKIVDLPDHKISVKRKTITTLIGKHGKETVLDELFELQRQELNVTELRRLYRTVSLHLQEQGLDPISFPSQWTNQEESQKIIDLIATLSANVRENRDTTRKKINLIEGELINQSGEYKEEIKKLEKQISLKEQHLAQIKTDISKEQLEIGNEKRAFLLQQKPKLLQIQRKEKRNQLMQKKKPIVI